MSSTYALRNFADEPLTPTQTTIRTPEGEILEGVGILKAIPVMYKEADLALDFHTYDVLSFDLMIGLPLEKFLLEAPTQGKLNVCLGKEVFSVEISRAKNVRTDPPDDYTN